MFVLEAIVPSIVPRACTSTPRGLELEIWEQNYCLLTSGGTAHALSMANEMPSSNASSPEVFVFPFRWTRVTEALGTRLIQPTLQSRSQSLVPFDQRSENESSGEQPFQACAIDADAQ